MIFLGNSYLVMFAHSAKQHRPNKVVIKGLYAVGYVLKTSEDKIKFRIECPELRMRPQKNLESLCR